MSTTPSSEEEAKNNIILNNIEEELKEIEVLPVFNKMSIAQALLKEIISKKERFDENKNKMIEKIRSYTYTYYKNLINSKEIYDTCKLKKDNISRTVHVMNKEIKSIDKTFYLPIYNFLFFIRNNNKFMLKIINRCNETFIKTLSYFIAHFCYENTISNNTNFIQDELQIIIYFLIEKIIFRNPDEILIYDKKYFLYRLLNYLRRKVDINNYLNSLLTDSILQIEKGKYSFILELVKKEDKSKNFKKSLTQMVKMQTDIHFLNTNKKEKISYDRRQGLLDRMNKNKEKIKAKIEIDLNKTDKFFINNDTTFEYISEKLTYYENLKEKDPVSMSMIYFLENYFKLLLSENIEDEDDKDKFRNKYFFNLFNSGKAENSEGKKYIENIKKQYDLVISFIVNLTIKIEESLKDIPKAIKNILNIIGFLIKKKMSNNEKQEKINYYLLMSKLKIFIGNLIIPKIKHFSNNGILGENILSRSTSELLKTIVKVFNSIILGKLFNNNIEESEYTIYNKFIIDILPKFLTISTNLVIIDNKNQDIPDNFSSITTKLLNTFEQVKDNNRIVNYNELKDKDKNEENIKYQSICYNWEILSMLIKTIEKEKEFFINKDNIKGENKIFEEVLKISDDIHSLCKINQKMKEYDYFFIDKIIYKKEFEQSINYIVQDIFDLPIKTDNPKGEIIRFKKSLSVILGYVGILHKESFLPFITEKENIKIFSNKNCSLFLDYKKNNSYNNIEFEINKGDKENKNQKNSKKMNKDKKKYVFHDRDSFFTRRKSVVYRWLQPEDDKKNDTDFKSVFFPVIMSLVRTELGNNFESEKFQKVIFCLSYIQTHLDDLPIEYMKNNYSKIFTDIISDTKILIIELQNNILNEFLMKIRLIERINEIEYKYYIQTKAMEKLFYIKYLYKKTKVYGNLTIQKNKNNEIITNIKFIPFSATESKLVFIKNFVKEIPKITDYETKLEDKENDDLFKFQQNIGFVDTIKDYFKEMKNSLKKEKIISKLAIDEIMQVFYGLEDYILKKIYIKLFPTKCTKEDNFIYKKCERLSFIKPSNIIKDEKFKKINENLLKISIDNVKEMNNQITPMEKINTFGRAMNFLKNSLEFNSGKEGFGVDDLLPVLIYIVIKAKIHNISTNYNYCLLYLNSDLQKRQYGSILTQIGVIIDIIKNMKYTDLSGVTQEQFGVDE